MAEVNCRDACGRVAVDTPEHSESQSAGLWLPVAGGWRCWACQNALTAAAGVHGTYEQGFVDALPANSIGALRKETASTILPPSVKG